MNDEMEIRYGFNIISNVASRLRSEYSAGSAEHALLYEVQTFAEQMPSGINENGYFITCFSKKRDDRDQWEEYGEKGRGICIGFWIEDSTPITVGQPDLFFDFVKVVYEKDRQYEMVKKFLRHFLQVATLGHQAVGRIMNTSPFALELRRLVIQLKSDKFSKEAEWRLVYESGDPSMWTRKKKDDGTHKRYITPETWSGTPPLPIEEIVVGPEGNANANFVRCLLNLNGYAGVQVVTSRISMAQ